MSYNPQQFFFREPKLYWLADRETESGESALQFIIIMELEYPARLGREPNEIYRVEGVVPVSDRYTPAKVRSAVIKAYERMFHTYRSAGADI